ncbi:MAG: slipin family protein [Acidimicrobiales bacterium]
MVRSRQTWRYKVADPDRPLRLGQRATVNPWQRGVLLRRGKLIGEVGPGSFRCWRTGTVLRRVDTRPSVVTVRGQEMYTADGVSVKATATALVRIVDVTEHITGTGDPQEVLHLAVQLALRQVTNARTVDELLEQRAGLGAELSGALGDLTGTGAVVDHADVKDLVLPADLRRAQVEVLVARASGRAALERARGETAALRNLTNAARLLADQPALLQLRALDHSDTTTVVVGLPDTPVAVKPTP